MDLIFSNVGLQPGAVAVTLASWLVHSGANSDKSRLVLMHTEETRPIAERLSAWAKTAPSLASVELASVAQGTMDTPEIPAPSTRVMALRTQYPDCRPVLFGDPGLNVQVVSAQRGLGPPYLRLHASDRELQIADISGAGEPRWGKAPLIDIGLPTLLDLADQPIQSRELDPRQVASLPKELAQALTQSPGHPRLRQFSAEALGLGHALAVLGYERRGQLYLLVRLRNPDRDIKSIAIANEVGQLRQRLRPLRPWVTAQCSHPEVREHIAREYLIPTMHPRDDKGLSDWLNGRPLSPGRIPGTVSTGSIPPPRSYDGEVPPVDIQDVTLAVCLGTDPSATLISIWTHRPRRFILFYDETTNRTRALASVLRDLMPELPVAQARFLPIDRLGRGIVTAYRAIPAELRAHTRLDITPGTKSQACEMARLADTDLWSIQGNEGLANRLLATERQPLNGPPLLLWTRIAHGPLTEEKPPICIRDRDPARAPFLRALHGALLKRLRSASQPIGLKRLLNELHNDRSSPIRWDGDRLWIDSTESRTVTSSDIGPLFEDLVSELLLALTPDELCCNIAWSWSEQMEQQLRAQVARRGGDPTQPHRRELDIALRLGHWVVAVSCKSSPERTHPTGDASREIEALAETAFGRFTLPVLVRTRFSQERKDASLARGAVLLDLVDLADPKRVRATLMTAFAKHSTVNRES